MAAVTYLPGWGAARARDTVNIDGVGVVPQEKYAISKDIYLENGKNAPFLKLLQELGTITDADDRYRWKTDLLVSQDSEVGGSIDSDSTVMTVANSALFTQYDVLWFPVTDAEAYVTSISAAGVLTIQWRVAPAAAIPAGAVVIRIGNAYPQFSQAIIGPTTVVAEAENVYQDLRHVIAISDQARHGNYRFGDEWAYQNRKKYSEHVREEEKTLWFGRQAALDITTHTSPIGFSLGLYYWTTTNATSLGAALTRGTFDNFLQTPLIANTMDDQDWWLFCSSRIQRQVTQFAYPAERTKTGEHQFGMDITRYVAPVRGQIIKMVNHPMFDAHGLNDLAVLVNMTRENVARVVHSVFDTKHYTSLMPYGYSGDEEFYRTVFTLCSKAEGINQARLEDVTP